MTREQASPPDASPRSARDHEPRRTLRCRRIEPMDLEPLAALLARGFPARDASIWRNLLIRLLAWVEAERLPCLGYLLAEGETLVGCLLTLYSPGGARCNMSSWYAEDDYRRYGSLLVNAALRDRSITYLNVSSERHTRPIIEAQGFRRYTEGVVLAAPLLALRGIGRAAVSWERPAGVALDPAETALMEHHAALGCIVFWCVAEGRAYPFVIGRRLVKTRVPIAQVIYCAEGTDWRRLSHAVGRALARRGLFLLLLDAAGPVPGLPGRFLSGRMPKYARGPLVPRCGDLAYTEAAVIGS